MYKLNLPIDYRQIAAVERRKNREQQRQSRIFNAKVRTIGVDINALDQQVNERKAREEWERQHEAEFSKALERTDNVAVKLQQRQEEDVRDLNKELNKFRLEEQNASTRREFDIYDPDALKKDSPIRTSDGDDKVGISSCQMFDGEDLKYKARHKLQQEQLREWTMQQNQAQKEAERSRRESDRLYERTIVRLDQQAVDVARADAECQRAINTSHRDFNATLAREKAEEERQLQQRELEENTAELMDHVYGDMLTENPDVAKSAFGSHRVIPDRWKGMSPAQVSEIRRMQEMQRLEKQRLHDEEMNRKQEWERYLQASSRNATLQDRHTDRTRKEEACRLLEENRHLAQQQRARLAHLDADVYTNVPTRDYFSQFNTSSR
ncbi:PREDICTED: RIB43A-like with coiled-coils protein 2 [Priapulus caudatus]|uniref:RIB43A-like with coiled-coils protein 2 n=1 Tax=Priapulus caudatus TaxID=37621 RepID=A0ABM1EXG3_PRICU|nr:PREDICTED: RIB43A-like with coiled-coils protein 2 [Priapulus caudatus]